MYLIEPAYSSDVRFVYLVTVNNTIGFFKISMTVLQRHPWQNFCLILFTSTTTDVASGFSQRLLMTCRVFAMTTDDVMASWRAVPIWRGRFQPRTLVTPFQEAGQPSKTRGRGRGRRGDMGLGLRLLPGRIDQNKLVHIHMQESAVSLKQHFRISV